MDQYNKQVMLSSLNLSISIPHSPRRVIISYIHKNWLKKKKVFLNIQNYKQVLTFIVVRQLSYRLNGLAIPSRFTA